MESLTVMMVYYVINSDKPFELYVNILAPDLNPEQQTDGSELSIWITNNDDIDIKLKGENHDWTQFYEEYGKDHYIKGPEYKANVSEGIYYIAVYSKNKLRKICTSNRRKRSIQYIHIHNRIRKSNIS